MKTLLISFTLILACNSTIYAGTPIAIIEIPDPVKKLINEYFPGAKLISAERDNDNGKIEYEIIFRYKEIILEVDVSSQGQVLDVEMKQRAY